VDVGVDEPREDRRPRQVDQTVGGGRFPRADPLDVTVVDQDPLPVPGEGERADAGRSIEGLQGAAILTAA
jgi:hypothetical protein